MLFFSTTGGVAQFFSDSFDFQFYLFLFIFICTTQYIIHISNN